MFGVGHRFSRPTASSPGTIATGVGLGLIAALLAAGLTVRGAADVAVHPAAITVLLLMLSLPLIRWAAAGDRNVMWIAFAGLLAKGAGTYVRFRFNAASGADANYYNRAGQQAAELLSSGFITPDDPRLLSRGTGTNHVSYIVGWLYHLVGPRFVTGYIVWSFMAFIGLACFYRAATDAIPELDRVRYAIFVFLLPSLLFWPSSLGKDALMVGALGVAALGAAALANHEYTLRRIAPLAFGLGLAAWIRPHVAALLILALAAGLIWPRRGAQNIGRQIVVSAVLFVVLAFALGQAADYFGAERFEVTALLDETARRTAEGGSEFTPVRVSGPLSFALAAVTVLLRPLPFEASSTAQLVSASEGALFVAIAIGSLNRLRNLPRMFLEHAYVRMCVIYTLGFIMAFSVISNFGILARQRAQLWPFLLVLLALPTRKQLADRAAAKQQATAIDDQPTPAGSASSDVYVP